MQGGCIRLINTSLRRMGRNSGGNGGVVVLMSSVAGKLFCNVSNVHAKSLFEFLWCELRNDRVIFQY